MEPLVSVYVVTRFSKAGVWGGGDILSFLTAGQTLEHFAEAYCIRRNDEITKRNDETKRRNVMTKSLSDNTSSVYSGSYAFFFAFHSRLDIERYQAVTYMIPAVNYFPDLSHINIQE